MPHRDQAAATRQFGSRPTRTTGMPRGGRTPRLSQHLVSDTAQLRPTLDPAPRAWSLLGHTPAPRRHDRKEPPLAWSTRELAGSIVKSVRYHHQLGLLDEPARLVNGYKQYEVRHLVRLLQITRLIDLGVPLAQIESIGSSVDDPAAPSARSTSSSPPPSSGCSASAPSWRRSSRTGPAPPCLPDSPRRDATSARRISRCC